LWDKAWTIGRESGVRRKEGSRGRLLNRTWTFEPGAWTVKNENIERRLEEGLGSATPGEGQDAGGPNDACKRLGKCCQLREKGEGGIVPLTEEKQEGLPLTADLGTIYLQSFAYFKEIPRINHSTSTPIPGVSTGVFTEAV